MNNITQRTITGAVYVLAVIGAIVFSPIISAIFFGAVAFGALWEFYNNVRKADIYPNIYLGFAIGICVYLVCCAEIMMYWPAFFELLIGFLLVFVLFIVELFRKKDNPFGNIAYTLLGVIYIVLPLGLTNFINSIFSQNFTLMGVFIIAWSNDTFAYLTGRWLGKHKLFERISPKKTWEGFAGGVFFSLVAGFVISYVLYKMHAEEVFFPWHWLAIALIVSVIGTCGDLVESMFKRQIGVKDSGNILPGHGGLLDRFDIIFMTLPFVLIYLVIIYL